MNKKELEERLPSLIEIDGCVSSQDAGGIELRTTGDGNNPELGKS